VPLSPEELQLLRRLAQAKLHPRLSPPPPHRKPLVLMGGLTIWAVALYGAWALLT
jgi:hypothetical protein